MVTYLKPKKPLERQKNAELSGTEMFAFFEIVFKTDIRFKIIVELSNREAACLREISRNVGISHKNLAKYLETLEQKGVVETYPVGVRNKVYRLAPKYSYVRQFHLHLVKPDARSSVKKID